jgi:hypothetical protein
MKTMISILNRLIYVLQTPLFFVYMCIPFLWVIDMPYWIFTGKNLMNDWSKYNGI